jgi:hypothetical protein
MKSVAYAVLFTSHVDCWVRILLRQAWVTLKAGICRSGDRISVQCWHIATWIRERRRLRLNHWTKSKSRKHWEHYVFWPIVFVWGVGPLPIPFKMVAATSAGPGETRPPFCTVVHFVYILMDPDPTWKACHQHIRLATNVTFAGVNIYGHPNIWCEDQHRLTTKNFFYL